MQKALLAMVTAVILRPDRCSTLFIRTPQRLESVTSPLGGALLQPNSRPVVVYPAQNRPASDYAVSVRVIVRIAPLESLASFGADPEQFVAQLDGVAPVWKRMLARQLEQLELSRWVLGSLFRRGFFCLRMLQSAG